MVVPDVSPQRVINVISIKQPWASLIVAGIKDVENRTWDTAYRGLLGIHSSQSFDRSALKDPFVKKAMELVSDGFPLGTILGTVQVKNIVRNSVSSWALPKHYHWLLSNAQRLDTPIRCKGALQIWQKDIAAQG